MGVILEPADVCALGELVRPQRQKYVPVGGEVAVELRVG